MPRTLSLLLLLVACKDQAPGDDSATDDSATDDTGSPPVEGWAWCEEEGQGLGSGATLQITASALYCGGSDEGRELSDERAAKVQLYLPPQTLSLPTETTEGAFTLPACLRAAPEAEGPRSSGPGTLSLRVDTYGSETWHELTLTQPLEDSSGQTWTLTLSSWGEGSPAQVVVDGDYPDPFAGGGVTLSACPGDCTDYSAWRSLLSCTFASEDSDQHTFVFEGGELVLDLRIGQSMASTEPAMLVGARGTLDGVDFEQTDYWSLVYNPEHHHFSRDAQVWLPSPIGEVCALEVRAFDPWDEAPPTTVHALDCAGASLGERALSAESFSQVP